MKRYRHYTKNGAIILSCFGSVIEQEQYLNLKKLIEDKFKDWDVFISIGSRMVLKDLLSRGFEYKTLAQSLADADMLGYKNIIVSSINLFPTDEHNLLKKTVDGFKQFSFSNIRYTDAIFTKTKEVSLFLKELDNKISKKNRANLYIIHGVPRLDITGLDSVSYVAEFLKIINSKNYTCSLEGANPYYAIKQSLVKQMQKDKIKKLQIVPMLLVSGNHYIKDMNEICDELSENFKTKIAKPVTKDEKFNLLNIPQIQDIIISNIKQEIIKLGH